MVPIFWKHIFLRRTHSAAVVCVTWQKIHTAADTTLSNTCILFGSIYKRYLNELRTVIALWTNFQVLPMLYGKFEVMGYVSNRSNQLKYIESVFGVLLVFHTCVKSLRQNAQKNCVSIKIKSQHMRKLPWTH